MREFIPPPRFFHDLDSLIDRAKKGEADKANLLLTYFAHCKKRGEQIDSRVQAYVDDAVVTGFSDPKNDFQKAFGLKRAKAGNPGGLSKMRRLTPTAREEVAQIMVAKMNAGKSYQVARDEIVEELRGTKFTIEATTVATCYKEHADKFRSTDDCYAKHAEEINSLDPRYDKHSGKFLE